MYLGMTVPSASGTKLSWESMVVGIEQPWSNQPYRGSFGNRRHTCHLVVPAHWPHWTQLPLIPQTFFFCPWLKPSALALLVLQGKDPFCGHGGCSLVCCSYQTQKTLGTRIAIMKYGTKQNIVRRMELWKKSDIFPSISFFSKAIQTQENL